MKSVLKKQPHIFFKYIAFFTISLNLFSLLLDFQSLINRHSCLIYSIGSLVLHRFSFWPQLVLKSALSPDPWYLSNSSWTCLIQMLSSLTKGNLSLFLDFQSLNDMQTSLAQVWFLTSASFGVSAQSGSLLSV